MRDTLKKLWKFTGKRKNHLISALILSFLRSTLGITQIFAIILTVRGVTGAMEPGKALWAVVGLTAACVLGNFVISYAEQLANLKAGMYSVADQRIAMAARLRKMPLGFFRQEQAENIVATLNGTMQGIEMASTMTLVGIVSGLFSSVALGIFMLFYDWRLGLITAAGIVCYLLVVRWQMVVSRKAAPERQAAQTGLATAALTFLQGVRVIKSFRFQNGDESLQKAIDESRRANLGLTDKSMASQFSAHVVIALFEGLLLSAAVFFTIRGDYDLERAIVMVIFAFFALASLNQAGSILSMIGMVESGLREVEQIEEAPVMEETKAPKAPQSQAIHLEQVRFAYGDHEILHGITADIAPHTLTAVIGPSGAGKTTLCQLIARFHDIPSGSISIGGADIRDIPYETLMEKISIVFQNVYLFEDSILNNIRFGRPDASLEEVQAAARAARCDDFIKALPQGYDTQVLEGGSNLSGGEKQRISIARAILKDSPIIILDEATSALDAESEGAFFDAVDALIEDKTVIMIAHRLSTVRRADQILAIRDGKLVQQGSPAELAEQPGLYADFLASRQQAAGWNLSN